MKYPEYINNDMSGIQSPTIDIPAFPGDLMKHIRLRRLNNFYDRDRDKSYRLLLILDGVKTIQVDHDRFPTYPCLIVIVAPGQKLRLELSGNPNGWVLYISKIYFNLLSNENFDFGNVDYLSSDDEIPRMVLSPEVGDRIHSLAKMVEELSASQNPHKENGVKALLEAIFAYCDNTSNINLNLTNNLQEVNIVSTFKQLVTDNYSSLHMVLDYARMMSITPKYLNQVVKHLLGITAKQVIQEQIIIAARHELKFSNFSIKEIAFSLGFSDPYHFSSFFKEMVGISPTLYRDR